MAAVLPAGPVVGLLAKAPLDFAGTSLAWSPYDEGRLAVSSAANFGIVGNGAQLVLDVRPTGPPPAPPALAPAARLMTNDAVNDCAWSEQSEHVLASVCGDGSLKLWDLSLPPHHGGRPIAATRAHDAEGAGVDWSSARKELLATCGWDRALKVWACEGGSLRALTTLLPPAEPTAAARELHDARWAPHAPSSIATAGGDGAVRVWSADSGRCELTVGAHEADVLSVDWHKYAPHVLASASVDQSLRVWDLRRPAAPTAVLRGHRLAVRRARFSPHDSRLLLSASYDMSAAVWDVAAPPGAPPLGTFAHHSEFVVGAEWSLFRPGLFATVSWDGAVALVQAPPPPGP